MSYRNALLIFAAVFTIVVGACSGGTGTGENAGPSTSGADKGGTGFNCDSNELCKALNGKVYYVGGKWDTGSTLDSLVEASGKILNRKNAFYFENSTNGMKFIEVVKEFDSHGYTAIGGTVTIGQQVTKDNKKYYPLALNYQNYCSQSESISELQRGSNIETILTTFTNCNTTSKNNTYDVTINLTPEGATEIGDKDITLIQAFSKPASSKAAPLLGVYYWANPALQYDVFTVGGYSYYLYLYTNPQGNLYFRLIGENPLMSATQRYYKDVLGSALIDTAQNRMTLTPHYGQIGYSDFALIPGESPFFPPYIIFASSQDAPSTHLDLPIAGFSAFQNMTDLNCTYTYNQTQLKTGVSGNVLTITQKENEGLPNEISNESVFVKIFQGGDFPGTSGIGVHYIWSIVPQSLIQ